MLKSKYKGVYEHKSPQGKRYWQSRKMISGVQHTCGKFPYTDEGERAAALAYDKHCIRNGIYDDLNILKISPEIRLDCLSCIAVNPLLLTSPVLVS